MDTAKLFTPTARKKAILTFVILLILMIVTSLIGNYVQRDFGQVEVSNLTYPNESGIMVRAKLLRPINATNETRAPGIVYIHGYQNNRETSDAYCIELARRGFVVLNIDAIGRGNSGVPRPLDDPEFDDTFGAAASFAYLQGLPFVDPDSLGMMGHSIGAEIAYYLALGNPDVKALVISGFGYTQDAASDNPSNMLMIFGRWDEYRDRMTGTTDFAAEWMHSPQTQAAFAEPAPDFSTTYGSFEEGTARRVYMPNLTHIQESHSAGPVAEATTWMTSALNPPATDLDPHDQIWHIKEYATLIAMLSCFAAILPLGLLLLQTPFFAHIQGKAGVEYAASRKEYIHHTLINGLLMLLYLPLILTIFGFHVYVIQIDKLFPMMIVNGILFWFAVTNLIGFFLFRRWYRRKAQPIGTTLKELGVSEHENLFSLSRETWVKTVLLAGALFAFAYLSEYILELIFITDFRFIFPFASDLTDYRWLMFLTYFPFMLVGFLQMGIFMHAQIRTAPKATWFKTFASRTGKNLLAMLTPIVVMLMMQYLPLFLFNVVPFIGPSAALVGFMINLVHIIIVLLIAIPLSTWFYQLTGKIYVGAVFNALLVTWMFVSSQVIAPIPV